jgi:molybdopterin/thiamine biosynthesis adenylyltransferase
MVCGVLARRSIGDAPAGHLSCTFGSIHVQVKVKIPRRLFDAAISDLNRPHDFASERVGFFSTKTTRAADVLLVHCISYHSIADNQYLRDRSVGARIGPKAITDAMERCVEGVGQLHVHAHGGRDTPAPSHTDNKELPGVARSFWNVQRAQVSGWGILTSDSAWMSAFISADSDGETECDIVIVGSPLTLASAYRLTPQTPKWWRRLFRKSHKSQDRYDRQSFLGKNADQMFANLRVGVIGLGGGGSHIVQQLAHLGVTHFVISDSDSISESNLNRTVGATEADVDYARAKVDIAKRQIRGLHPDADVTAIGKWGENSDRLLHCDIILGCLDSFIARRDLESFCRRNLIPYIDVGMDVLKEGEAKHEIIGQVIVSMPGQPCMHCMNFLTPELLAEEGRRYGAAGGRPQVVWSNGVLSSAAVGVVVDLVTGWSGRRWDPLYLNFRGSDMTLVHDRRLAHLSAPCPHYPLTETGDPTWRIL